MKDQVPRIGLIMTGGGARAAYQVGVLRAVAELLPRDIRNPFQIICGTSAGAVNAAVLAANGTNFRHGVRELVRVWKNFTTEQVYRSDAYGVACNTARWLLAALAGGRLGESTRVSLLDNAPLAELVRNRLDFSSIQASIDAGDLAAVAVTCSGYSSGQAVTFYQGRADLEPWKRARRLGLPMRLAPEHLLASSALPFIFPAVRINREYFGDGSMRQVAPISPALHLGADRLFIIGVGRQLVPRREFSSSATYPSLAQIAGHCLNSIFLDSLEVDLERLQRINRTLAVIPPEVREEKGIPMRQVGFRLMAPTDELEQVALDSADELPRPVRLLLYGARKRSGANLLSYLLFEKSYCRALIRMGYRDTMQHQGDLMEFLGWCGPAE